MGLVHNAPHLACRPPSFAIAPAQLLDMLSNSWVAKLLKTKPRLSLRTEWLQLELAHLVPPSYCVSENIWPSLETAYHRDESAFALQPEGAVRWW